MALVNVTNVTVLDNPTVFTNPYQFEVEFECLGELEDDIEWKVTYVGSAEDTNHDQVLEEVLVGPVPLGVSKFVLQADAPDPSRIPVNDLVGVTVVFITCSYRETDFIRIGYYVNNEYYHTSPLVPAHAVPAQMQIPEQPAVASAGPSEGGANPIESTPTPLGEEELRALIESGAQIDVNRVYRNIMHEKPRVTRFQIDWAPRPVGGAAAMQMDGSMPMDQGMGANDMNVSPGASGQPEIPQSQSVYSAIPMAAPFSADPMMPGQQPPPAVTTGMDMDYMHA